MTLKDSPDQCSPGGVMGSAFQGEMRLLTADLCFLSAKAAVPI